MNPREVIKKEDALLGYYLCGQLANLLARLSLKIKWLTPNVYTSLSFISALFTVYFFSLGTYNYLLFGILGLLFTLTFDCADGQTARLTNQMSKFGHWFDYHSDKVKDILLVMALAYGAYQQTGWVLILLFPGLIIGFQFLRNITRLNRIIFDYENNISKHEPTLLKPKSGQFMTCLKHSTLFKEADRYTLFILGALTNQIIIMLVIYGLIEFGFAASSAYLNYKEFRKFDLQNHA